MDPACGGDQLLEGWRALEAAQWEAARAAFEAALGAQETPDGRDGLGQALWFLGAVEEGGTRSTCVACWATARFSSSSPVVAIRSGSTPPSTSSCSWKPTTDRR